MSIQEPFITNQSLFTINQYLLLLDLTYGVAQSMEGKQTNDSRWPDCQQLALKLYFHASTVYWLREGGTKTPVPYSLPGGSSFYDMSSVAVLTRACFETYLVMFKVFFEPETEDEFEFNHALWLLAGFIIRETSLFEDPSFQSQLADAQIEIQEMRTRLQNTNKFKTLKAGEQKKVLRGEGIRGWKDVAKSAGFNEKIIEKTYAYYSGVVHADGLSGTQLMTAKTAQEQVEYIEVHMSLIMVLLSKMIIHYAQKFPEAKATCQKNPLSYHLAQEWAKALATATTLPQLS